MPLATLAPFLLRLRVSTTVGLDVDMFVLLFVVCLSFVVCRLLLGLGNKGSRETKANNKGKRSSKSL